MNLNNNYYNQEIGNMKILNDLNESIEYLVENTSSGKNYFIEGNFLSADIPNRNRRIYPKHVMEHAVENYTKEFIKNNRAMGELNHPTPSNPTINLDKVSHVIESLTFNGSLVIGKARVLSTPMGNILKTLIDEKVKVGVSSRGLGSIKKLNNGLSEVQNDFYLGAIDVVSDPSGIGCFVDGISESSEWILENGEWKQISGISIEEKINIFAKFLKTIK